MSKAIISKAIISINFKCQLMASICYQTEILSDHTMSVAGGVLVMQINI